ncbi:MAG: PAS domain S-box protein [Nitrospirales bacterium]|nr:PAS domain S-box protein [Nitrospirales bacterium]
MMSSQDQLKSGTRSPKWDVTLLIAICALMAAIFVLDLYTKTGVAIGMLYVSAIMLTPWLSHEKSPFIVAGGCTVLAIIGLIYSPGVNVVHSGSTIAANAVINRLLSLSMIWAAALLTYQYRQGMEVRLRLGSIVESTHDAIIGQTLKGQVTSWNNGAEQMFGYSPQESIGQFMPFIFPPERIDEEKVILEKLHSGKQIKNFETIRRRKDGQEIPVSVTISPIIDRWGNVIGASRIARDISQQKKMEHLLAIQNLTLARHSASLKQSNEDLEQFAYIASHDLQEPLRTIHGFTQLLAERYKDQLDDQGREFIGFVTDGANRMQTLIQDLLKYSRIQAQELNPVPVNGEEVLQEILEHLRMVIGDKQASITHDPLPVIKTDRSHFQHLLQNLITNAIKFHGPKPPNIHLSAQEGADEWLFSVQDNGIGMEPEYFERIFLPFKRLHTREEYQGTGIGLAICKKIVERRGGRIWVESEQGKGAKFSFAFPKL